MPDEERHWLQERDSYTHNIRKSPYNCGSYIRRAICYEKLKYPDLAAGDAYRALLLTDEVLDESGEWHELAVEALDSSATKVDTVLGRKAVDGLNINGGDEHSGGEQNEEKSHTVVDEDDDGPWHKAVAEGYARRAYEILARTLLDCGDLKAAYDFMERGLKVFPDHGVFKTLQDYILHKHCQNHVQKDSMWKGLSDFKPRTDLPENGSARREIYSWNSHETDRFSDDSMFFLNAEIRKVACKCEVRSVQLPILKTKAFCKDDQKPATITQLGVFATEDIHPNGTILLEPSVLTSSTRLFDPFCDACSSALPTVDVDHPLPSCPNCDDIVFCSEACLTRAQTLYHRLQRTLYSSNSPNSRNV